MFLPFSYAFHPISVKFCTDDVHKNSFSTSEFREIWRIETYGEINFCLPFPL
jgi:hypothetical protein